MANPTQRHTKGKVNKRRMHIHLDEKFLVSCQKCGKKVVPHTVCSYCGYYKGNEVIDVLAKLTKKEKKQREKEMQKHEHEHKEKALSAEELSKK